MRRSPRPARELLEQRAAPSSFSRDQNGVRALQNGIALEVLSPGGAGRSTLAHVLLGIAQVPDPVRGGPGHPERVEPRRRVVIVRGRAPAPPAPRRTQIAFPERIVSASDVNALPWIFSRRPQLRPHDGFDLPGDRPQVAELPGGARGVVAALERRLELHRPQQELRADWFASRARARLPASSSTSAACARALPAARRRARRAGGGLVEVVRADLEQLLVGPLAQPLRELRVLIRPRRLRQRRVRDLADEHVLEAVRSPP